MIFCRCRHFVVCHIQKKNQFPLAYGQDIPQESILFFKMAFHLLHTRRFVYSSIWGNQENGEDWVYFSSVYTACGVKHKYFSTANIWWRRKKKVQIIFSRISILARQCLLARVEWSFSSPWSYINSYIFSDFVNSLTPLKMSSTNKMLFMFIISMLGVLLTRIVCPMIIDSIHIKIFDTSMLARFVIFFLPLMCFIFFL